MTSMYPAGWRLGSDVAGVVVAPAADGSGPAAGTRVVARVDEQAWGEQVAVPVGQLAAVPGSVSFSQAATLPMAGLSALRLLRAVGHTLGTRILITGAAGGVGRFTVELGAAAGTRITAVATGTERGKGLLELGAEQVVSDVADAEGSFPVIIESAGGASLKAALGKIAPGGTVLLFGNSSGESTPVNFFEFFGGHEGASITQFLTNAQGDDAADLAQLVELVAEGRLHPNIDLEVDWSEANAAAVRLMNRQIAGKAVLVVSAAE
jgi:NADPH:quinone reductase-like Zn-dependent oxidoreductase